MTNNITSICATCAFQTTLPSNWCQDPTTYASNIAISFIVGFFLVVGSVGNFITMLVIMKNKTLRTPSNYFLYSLCISDLISGLICSPLWLYRRTWGFCYWELINGLCSFYWAADFATNYATAMHILSFALLRCFAVHRPFKMSQITQRRVVIYLCVLWAIAIVISMPLVWLMGIVENRGLQPFGTHWPSCSICNNENIAQDCISQYNTYMLFVNIVFFYIPELCVIVLSCCIGSVLIRRRRWRKRTSSACNVCATIPEKSQLSIEYNQDAINETQIKSDASSHNDNNSIDPHQPPNHINMVQSNRRPHCKSHNAITRRVQIERNIFSQLSLIVVAFMIGYMPGTIYLVWTTAMSNSNTKVNGDVDYWFGVLSYLCLRLSECMNPVMYNLGSGKIRRATRKLFERKRQN